MATQAWREPNVLEEGQQIRVLDATIDVVLFLYGFFSDDDVEAHERLVIGRYRLSFVTWDSVHSEGPHGVVEAVITSAFV